MDIYLGSIVNRFYKVVKMTVYTEKLPQDFERPSAYFPSADVNAVNGGMSFEFADRIVKIIINHHSGTEAANVANEIRDDLINTRNLIEFVDEEGTALGAFFRVSDVQIRPNELDDLAALTLTYRTEEKYGVEPYIPIENVNIKSEVVEGDRKKEDT